MTEQQATPLHKLRLLPSGDAAPDTGVGDTDTAPDTGGGAGVAPDTVLVSPSTLVSPAAEVVPMTVPERAGVTLRCWAAAAVTAAAELWLHPGKLIHKLAHADPDSTRAHLGYVKSREWVPHELRGTKAGKAITVSGWAYHVLFAIPADKALQGLEVGARKARWAVQRQLRLLGFLIPCIVILLIII